MNKAQALQQFWSSFGLTAFDEFSAYDEKIELPANYITYEIQTTNILNSVDLSASLWYNSTSWKEISEKADEIAEYIGYGGRVIKIDGGYIWVKMGTPFAQRMAVEGDDNIRRIYLSISVDFFTAT